MDQVSTAPSWEPWLNNESEQVVVEDAAINPRYPNGIVVGVLMVVGVVGNALVLYIYQWRMEHTVFTTFVLFLAALDLTTTLTAMPLDVALKVALLPRSEVTEAMCKLAHFEVYASSLASGSILLLIAATRHAKVCRPTQPPWTVRQARVGCLVIVLLASLLCTVSLVINGLEKAHISTGVTHLPPPPPQHPTPTLANHTLPPTLLPHVLVREEETVASEDSHTNDNNNNDSASLPMARMRVVEVYICRSSEKQRGTALYYALYGPLMTAYVTICLALVVLHARLSCTLLRFRHTEMHRQGNTAAIAGSSSLWSDHHHHHHLNHITSGMFRIFGAITLVFVLSYLPHLACVAVQRLLFPPGEAIPRTTRIFLDLAYNFPYVNVVANPFIYGFMSKRFRAYCVHVVCSCRCCN